MCAVVDVCFRGDHQCVEVVLFQHGVDAITSAESVAALDGRQVIRVIFAPSLQRVK